LFLSRTLCPVRLCGECFPLRPSSPARPRESVTRDLEPSEFDLPLTQSTAYWAVKATNSSTVSPLERIRLRKVPLAISRRSGTDNVVMLPTFTRIIWLPRCRAKCQPALTKMRTTSLPLQTGNEPIRQRPRLAGSRESEVSHVQPALPGTQRSLHGCFPTLLRGFFLG
jgi:hypothetical protein